MINEKKKLLVHFSIIAYGVGVGDFVGVRVAVGLPEVPGDPVGVVVLPVGVTEALEVGVLVGLVAAIGLILFFREEYKHPTFFVPLFTAGGASFFLVEWILKPFFAHPRPTVEIGAIIVSEIKTDFSFPSGHATIAWAMAVVLSGYEPKYRPWFYILATLISFSRIFLGVHYPFDVIAGALLGAVIGIFSLRLRKIVRKQNTLHI